ncbi:myo-inositol 2-dehydrogenase / D-chiro-inositol 1-dehydrogenase [Pedococcus dokdonensis]|uniref:Myo-inositol 2-dehydrogenase / D-chiro-inositol 1-dehydrogenase n=1 Tax=Pedococcus dokdonensis TaxID=443156 RepID=A0A1H0TFX4_9MICO|nr:Gfo/Idh/MocA family oxidoreductase [Pedococcus dokdonensis]SDP52731.1 myo-inositol 2-dehydrogenase / D-chiro-inositol 1-dehydrogenase [Pedococcus dokdonensis]
MRIGLAGVGRIGAFHADTLRSLDAVDQLVVADVDAARAEQVATALGLEWVATTDDLLDAGLDALVIATATPGHAPLLRAGIARRIPTFCEKPVASTLDETIDLARLGAESDVPVHIGFQRRFDHGYRHARDAVASGELGFVHTVVANTRDATPPHPSYVPGSGGIFRDCNVHDFDIIRFVTGREVVSVYATGANQGADFFAEAGDVDTGAALLTLDGGTLAQVSSTRYNGAGHDVRMEVLGELGAVGVGLDQSLALRSMEEEVDFPSGPVKMSFMERFLPAYRAELTAFFDVAARRIPSPCTLQDALQAFRVAEACEVSRAERRVVDLTEIKGA